MPQYYPLRAVNTKRTKYFDFTIRDGICPAQSNEFLLMNRRNSPLLRISPIFRGTEDGKFFEGDIVLSGKEIYCIQFSNEFIAVNSMYRRKLDELENPQVVGTTVLTDSKYYSCPNKLTFKYRDYVFGFGSFGGALKDKLIVNTDGWQSVDPDEIYMCASVLEGYGRIFLNEEIQGKKVVMRNGRILLE